MTNLELHQSFVQSSRHRWQRIVSELEADDPARLQSGRGEIAFSILGMDEPVSAEAISIALANRPRGSHTLSADDWTYSSSERNEVERWRGDPASFSFTRGIVRYDYARIMFRGSVYRLKGFEEGWHGRDPNTVFDVSASFCDVGCMLLYAADLADFCGYNLNIAVSYRYSGLANRRLDMTRGFMPIGDFVSDVDVYCSPIEMFSAREIRLDLQRVLREFTAPLYASFSDFVLGPGPIFQYVNQEIPGNYPG